MLFHTSNIPPTWSVYLVKIFKAMLVVIDEYLALKMIFLYMHLAHTTNPYTITMQTAEFFTCGFLKDTYIVVADSLIDEVTNCTYVIKSMVH